MLRRKPRSVINKQIKIAPDHMLKLSNFFDFPLIKSALITIKSIAKINNVMKVLTCHAGALDMHSLPLFRIFGGINLNMCFT